MLDVPSVCFDAFVGGNGHRLCAGWMVGCDMPFWVYVCNVVRKVRDWLHNNVATHLSRVELQFVRGKDQDEVRFIMTSVPLSRGSRPFYPTSLGHGNPAPLKPATSGALLPH